VELVELPVPVVEDCEPMLELDPLVWGLLLALESGVEVLLVLPVCEAELLGLELLLEEELGEELMSEDDDEELDVCGGVELLLEEPLFGEVLLGLELLEELPLGEVDDELLLGELDDELP
jgi:hypothetical protein